MMETYDPFVRGPFPVGVRTFQTTDPVRNRTFPCEIWYPAAAHHTGEDLAAEKQDSFDFPLLKRTLMQMAVRDAADECGLFPLVLYSHPSMFHRRAATFLCTHLSSHGYMVAALDHSEVIAKELGPQKDESPAQRDARWKAAIDSRVPDIRFLLDSILNSALLENGRPDASRIGVVGHSFGGWTALALPDVEQRIRSIVALAPAGASNSRPGILPVKLSFGWNRDVPTLYLVAENDESLPLSGMHELFERTPATKRMVILKRSDHAHFMDLAEEIHEWFRTMPATGDLAAIQREMLPTAKLCSAKQAHLFVQGLTLCHLDATLKQHQPAQDFLASDLQSEIGNRGIAVEIARV